MTRSVWWRLPVLLVVATALPAFAEEPTLQRDRARLHSLAGEIAYREGRYADALREYEAGYALAPRPQFLINMAQAHRQLGHFDRAIALCERYLAATDPASPMAGAAREMLESLETERAAAAVDVAPATVAPIAPVAPSPPRLPPHRQPPRRAWIWGLVAGAAVVVTAGVACAIVFAPATQTYPEAPLGTISFR